MSPQEVTNVSQRCRDSITEAWRCIGQNLAMLCRLDFKPATLAFYRMKDGFQLTRERFFDSLEVRVQGS